MANNPIDLHVGKRARHFREEKGLSQVELAKALGVSFQQVQKYESGANRLSMSRCWELCKFLGIEPSILFEGLPRTPAKRTDGEPQKQDGRGSRQRIELNRAFAGVRDAAARQQILALTKSLARLDTPARAAAE